MNLGTKLSLITIIASLSHTVGADTIILDDLIVKGSACVGTPCLDNENFDFDTLRIKSSEPKIRFQDTSNTASFPTQDWVMGITEGFNMTSVFYIQDITSGQNVMQIESGDTGGVALGAGSELVNGAISVGGTGTERRITYVAGGVNPTDAVTLAQFNNFEANATAAATADIAAVNTEISNLQAEMVLLNQRLDEVITRLDNLQ